MTAWMTVTDEIGPEKILYLHDPEVGLKGIIVVDTISLAGAGGGTRMLPDITTEEMCNLARAMTYKFQMIDLPMGGSKAGIWADPNMVKNKKNAILTSFGRIAKPLMESGVNIASDMGTDTEDVETIYQGAGVENQSSGLSLKEKDGEPLENHATGFGVVMAAKSACEHAGMDIKGATVAIEGFGKAGGGVARYMMEAGARVVAMSNIDGTKYNPDGLDIKALLDSRQQQGDKALTLLKDVKTLSSDSIFSLPVDILVPGARPRVINSDNAHSVKARIISSIANNPVTDQAEQILLDDGVRVVPDFLSNVGGVVVAIVDVLGGTADNLFHALEYLLMPLTKEILTDAETEKTPPRLLAQQRIKRKIQEIRNKQRAAMTFEEVLELAKKRLNL
jgi:glutamate dehydrogenase (NAD(P)+)